MVRRKKEGNSGLYFILGIIFVIYSVASFFAWLEGKNYQVILSYNVTEMLLVVLAIMLIQRTLKIKHQARATSFVVALLLLFFGILPIAIQLGISSVLPFTVELTPSFILTILILFFGSIYFIVDQYLALYRNEYS